jgi:hypothetical protein
MARGIWLSLLLQTGCGIGFDAIAGGRQTTSTAGVLRLESADAQLTCGGKPCTEFSSHREVTRNKVLPYFTGLFLDGACGAVALAANHGQLNVPACVCLALALADVTAGVRESDRLFEKSDRAWFDGDIELKWQGETVHLSPGFEREIHVKDGVFSSREAFESVAGAEAQAASAQLCVALVIEERVSWALLPVEDTALLGAIAARFQPELGRPNALPLEADFRLEPRVLQTGQGATLQLRLLHGPYNREVRKWSYEAPTPDGLRHAITAPEIRKRDC